MNVVTLHAATETSEACGSIEFLLGLWRRVLRVEDITPDSNFFDLGGDSLLALNLFLEIERATGRHLPITAIYDAQTVAEQAALLQEEGPPEFSPLVLLKAGVGDPLFLFHGIGGTVVEFAELGKLIDIDGAVYAVQAQGVDGTLPPLESVEEMAELYIAAIRSVQPKGPYRLCGYSFGGIIAVEVARRLKSAGEEIGLLFLIDAYAHPITWPKVSRFKVRLRKAAGRVFSGFRSPSPAMLKSAAHSLRAKAGRLHGETPAERLARKQQWLRHSRSELPASLLQTRFASDKALITYKPSRYPGKAIFLKAKYPDPDFPRDPKRVWRGMFNQMKVLVSPGSHLTIIGAHASSVAACINAAIREARCSNPERPSASKCGALWLPLAGDADAA